MKPKRRRSITIHRRRREPGEIVSPKASIRNHCLECCGYNRADVDACTAPECWLYPYRMGTGPKPENTLRSTERKELRIMEHKNWVLPGAQEGEE